MNYKLFKSLLDGIVINMSVTLIFITIYLLKKMSENLLEIYNFFKEQKDRNCLTAEQIKEMRIFRYRLTQVAFAKLLEVPAKTYMQWEQGRYTPDSGSRKLLLIANQYPDIFLKHKDEIRKLFGPP